MQTKRDTTIQDKQIDFLAHMLDEAMEDKAGAPLRESGILLNVDDPSDAAKIGGKQNAKGVIVKYNGKFHVVTRYDYVSGRLWLYDRAFDTEAEAYDYRDYLNSHGEY